MLSLCVFCTIEASTGYTTWELESGRKLMDTQKETYSESSEEVWMPVPGTDGLIMASSLGRIKSAEREVKKRHSSGAVMTQKYKEAILDGTTYNGYRFVHYGISGTKCRRPVHAIVLEAFVGCRPDGMEACHYDGDSLNNRIDNLRWDTHYNNNMDRKRIGRYARGENHVMAKFTQSQVDALRAGKISYEGIGMSYTHYHRIMHNKSWAQ